MKKVTILIAALAAAAGIAQAGPTGYSAKQPPVQTELNVPSMCDCFDAGTLTGSAFVAGLIGGDDHDDELGGGVSLLYSFTENFGIEASAAWLGSDSTIHLFTANAVVRYPIKDLCLAPYLLAGGGVHTNSHTQGVFQAGGGIDWRFSDCVGVFVDAVYTWADETDDYTVVRGGVRMNF